MGSTAIAILVALAFFVGGFQGGTECSQNKDSSVTAAQVVATGVVCGELYQFFALSPTTRKSMSAPVTMVSIGLGIQAGMLYKALTGKSMSWLPNKGG